MVHNVPEWITDHEKRNVLFVCISQDLITFGFNRVPVGQNKWLLVERLLPSTPSDSASAFSVQNTPIVTLPPSECLCTLRGKHENTT